MDAKRRRPQDPDYDCTTVYIPPFEYQKLTATMKQYWDIKAQMYDKICLFKLGKFYEIFFNDAIICHKLLDLAWMHEVKRLHVGFPEKLLDDYIEKLVGLGHKLVVVEQTETCKMAAERAPNKRGDMPVNREISACYS